MVSALLIVAMAVAGLLGIAGCWESNTISSPAGVSLDLVRVKMVLKGVCDIDRLYSVEVKGYG